ncbi:hypothetical protein ACFWMG_30895 [Streptomyces sp. NPDC127074]|uniref:hypothetical protein n=1 Tax=Streptomyces sp. NPDC127074 TaxID=3347130 RepID=UPI0036662C51
MTLERPADLKGAAALASWLDRPAVDEVVVRVPWLDADDRKDSAVMIRRLFNDCGCAAAATGFTLAASVFLVCQLAVAGWSWGSAGLAALAGVIAGTGGKLLALAWSRHRLRTLLLRMAETAPAGQRGDHPPLDDSQDEGVIPWPSSAKKSKNG